MNAQEELITVAEASKILRLGKSKVYDLLNEGSLIGMHVGRTWRTSVEECDRFIRRQSQIAHLNDPRR